MQATGSLDTTAPGPWARLRQEWRPTLRLALPAVAAELGWMAMGAVDVLMVGRISPEAIGAVGLGSALFLVPAIFGVGLLLGLDALVAQAFGARRIDQCHRWLYQGVYLALLLTVPLTASVLVGIIPALAGWGINPRVLELTEPYLRSVTWSMGPLLVYTAFRRYLQAMHRVHAIAIALATANLVNVVCNWALIYGHFGAPAMGVRGAAWATVISRVYMTLYLLGAILLGERRQGSGLHDASARPDSVGLWQLFMLGLPAALQLTLEVGVFAAATALAGRLDAFSLAAHQIAINVISITFMVPMGISSAAAVRVGHAVGRGDPEGAARAGWAAIALGAGFMAMAAVGLAAVPRTIIGVYTNDAAVIALGARLLRLSALFQVFDGLQVVSTGAMRGLGDTRAPMFCNFVGHWALGLPLGYMLCFWTSLRILGIWMGLSVGLIAIGGVLLALWSRHVRALRSGVVVEPLRTGTST